MKITKVLCIFFAAAFLLTGCSSPAPQRATEPETVTEPDPADPQEQIKLLMKNVDTWRVPNDLEYEPYYYTVTDLDHNGRLEIIGASTQGTGIYTYGVVYEVGADFSSVQECMTPCKENSDLPELIMNSAPAAYDEAAHVYDYLFTNDTRNGAAEHYQSIVAVRLTDGMLTCTVLANSYDHYIDSGLEQHEYAVPSGDSFLPSSKEEYDSIISNYQSARQPFTAKFEWFNFEKTVNEEVLLSSWNVFQSSGE